MDWCNECEARLKEGEIGFCGSCARWWAETEAAEALARAAADEMTDTTRGNERAETTMTDKTMTGMNIRCLLCGSAEGARRLDLDHLRTISCDQCDESFTTDDLRAHIEQARRLLAWIDAAPRE